MPTLYLKGETGATLGPERVTLAELKIRDASYVYRTLDVDELTWTARTLDVDAGQTTIPDEGQKVSLYLDEDRLFHGHVTSPQLLLYGLRVQVVGPWWWLLRADAVSDQEDEEASTAERPTLQFASGDWSDHISAVLDLARDGYALPPREGTLATGYDIPFVSYSLTTLADVIARLLEWCGDAELWVDHSALSGETQAATSTTIQLAGSASAVDDDYNGLEIELRSGSGAGQTRVISDYVGSTKTATISAAWTTTPSAGDDYTLEIEPRINVSRRGSMSAGTLTIGSSDLIEPFELRKRVELELSQVVLPYVDRDASTDALQYQEQSSGTFAAGKRQIVVVSGPEIADFLPPTTGDDSFTVALINQGTASALKSYLFDRSDELAAARGVGGVSAASLAFGGTYTYADNTADLPSDPTPNTYVIRGNKFVREDGTVLSGTALNARRILDIDPLKLPHWAFDELGIERVVVSGAWVFPWVESSGGLPPSRTYYTLPDWAFEVGWDLYPGTPGVGGYVGSSSSNYDNIRLFAQSFEVEVLMVPSTTPTGLTSQGGAVYTFFSPPAGLAANMLAAANWVPWEGVVTQSLATLAAGQPLAKKWNFGGTVTEAASAGALLRSYEVDLASRRATYQFGPPARLAYRSLIDRTQRNPQDNIIEL